MTHNTLIISTLFDYKDKSQFIKDIPEQIRQRSKMGKELSGSALKNVFLLCNNKTNWFCGNISGNPWFNIYAGVGTRSEYLHFVCH